MRYRIAEHLFRCSLFCLLTFALFEGLPHKVYAQDRQATLLEVDDAIGPAISDYLQRGLKTSESRHAAVVIIRLDSN